MLRTRLCSRAASSSSLPPVLPGLSAAAPRTASPISAMVASGVRSSWAMMPIVASVWASCSRRRLAEDTPSSMPMATQKPTTARLVHIVSSLIGATSGPNQTNSRRASPAPSRTPTVAMRQSVVK